MNYKDIQAFQKERCRAREQATLHKTLRVNVLSDRERLGLKQELYNVYADAYERRTAAGLLLYQPDLDAFRAMVPSSNIVDLGSGPGRDASYLQKQGLHVLCVDFATEALKKCSRKGLETLCINFELELDSAMNDATLGGLWTNCSLTTTPRVKIEEILQVIYRKLLPGAPAFFGFIEDSIEKEGWIEPGDKYSLPRFRFRSSRHTLMAMLQHAGFFIHSQRVIPAEISGKNTYLNYLCVKSRQGPPVKDW